MNDFGNVLAEKPNKLVPVLIGGLSITAISAIPVLNLVNLLCCAGVMGGAIIGVWFYKKNFPQDMPFSVGDGAIIGTFSGAVAGIVTTLIFALTTGLFSPAFQEKFETEIENALQQSSFQDPATAEQVRQFLTQLSSTPLYLFVGLLFIMLLVFTLFGLFGGLIGGGIFKTRTLAVTPPPPSSQPPMQI